MLFTYTNIALFTYTNNEKSEREIKETIPFIITSKKKKNLRINHPNEHPNETKDILQKLQDADE